MYSHHYIGNQVVNFNRCDINSFNVEFFVSVWLKNILVFLEEVVNVFVESEESGVTGGSFEVLHNLRMQMKYKD
jgi:hypothetical protein